MRLVLKLKNNILLDKIEREYIRNFIYSCINGSKWTFYHDKPRYKHFCFSNLFPFNKEGKIEGDFNLIISSPYNEFIQVLQENLPAKIILGSKEFEIASSRIINTPEQINKVITATPVIVRLPKSLYDKYSVDSKQEYAFWTEKEVLNAFIDLITKNLKLRYEDFKIEAKMLGFKHSFESYDEKIQLFSTLKYKKTVYGWDKHFIGTMWELGIMEPFQVSDLVKYMYESGLGERNASSGSGFLNLLHI